MKIKIEITETERLPYFPGMSKIGDNNDITHKNRTC